MVSGRTDAAGLPTVTARATLLIRRRRPIGEPAGLEPAGAPGSSILRGSAGAGRVVHALAELGVPQPNLVQLVVDPGAPPDAVERLDAGRLFVTVVLGSHLVNLPDERLRRAFLETARRHLVGDGAVLVEHHPIDWAETAAPTQPTPGSTVGMEDVRRHPPFVSAVSTFDIGGRFERQPFTARVLSEGELDDALREAGLRRRRRLGPTWLEAGPIEPPTSSVPPPSHP
jgi:hypothetical protein